MKQSILLTLLVVVAISAFLAGPASAQPSPSRTLRASDEVLEAIQSIPLRGIPPALLADAQGIAIIPGVLKGGFVVGGRIGHGLVLSRAPDGSWAGPAFITLGGASVGLQIGVQSTDVILVFKTRRSLERVLMGKDKLTLGADVAVAAGPIGRQAEAGTDGRLRAEIYSYSRSRGLFAGVSLEGAAIVYDRETTQEFTQSPDPAVMAAAEKLKAQLAAASAMRPPVGEPSPLVVPPAGPGPILVPPPLQLPVPMPPPQPPPSGRVG